MCTYNTEHAQITGSGKGRAGWVALSRATVYYDHPVHAQAEHTLNIDLTGDDAAGNRIAVELTAESARELVAAIERALGNVPPELLDRDAVSTRPGVGEVTRSV
ncbi:MAG TPA: DUF6295 family protein [Jatrophihabitans sp.]|jgi:hypothetical protein|uniref:DUF6295 family protein n=1 Tax=Jatrophihabitans sp. TaxID=1932789 RepID=UPI002F1A5316